MSSDVRLIERPGLELVNLRGRIHSARFTRAVREVFAIDLPAIPNTVLAGAAYAALWLGPDEWLLHSNEPRPPTAERKLRPLLIGELSAVVDVSSGYTVLALDGMRAREVLQKGCPLDLHPRVFDVGQCAQSHYFKAGIILRPTEPAAYELVVRRSFADYAAGMLRDAAQN